MPFRAHRWSINRHSTACARALRYPFKDTQHAEEINEPLLEHGADINAKDNAGHTLLDQMLRNGRPVWRPFCVGTAASLRERRSTSMRADGTPLELFWQGLEC